MRSLQLVDDRLGLDAGEHHADDLHEQAGVGEVGLDRFVDARVLHLHRDGPSVLRDRAMHLADRRRRERDRIPRRRRVRRGDRRALPSTTCAASSGAIDGAFGLELRELLAHRLGQALVEVARHLADLHQRALHVAERVGDLLRRPQLVLGVELLPPIGGREHSPGAVQRVRASGLRAEAWPPRRCARLVIAIARATSDAILVRALHRDVRRRRRAERADRRPRSRSCGKARIGTVASSVFAHDLGAS